jgi:hypothetical protein
MEPNPHPSGLSRNDILAGLTKLSERLADAGVHGEICLFGGTVMVLAFNARLSTRDVDAIFQPATLIRSLAAEIAVELGWPSDWLNDGVKGFQSTNAQVTSADLPQFPHLRIFRPTSEYLLAMKCMAARALDSETSGDARDIKTLIQHLGLTSTDSVLDIVTRFFPPERIPAKTQFMIHEVIASLRKENPA